ncbi:MAG: hypothetical protein QG670_2067 [Thermoproteota archaeon]|nr:hypothetical protein [Thermoproteota archaeon]
MVNLHGYFVQKKKMRLKTFLTILTTTWERSRYLEKFLEQHGLGYSKKKTRLKVEAKLKDLEEYSNDSKNPRIFFEVDQLLF